MSRYVGGEGLHTANEQSISSEYNSLISILQEVADTVLGVTRCMQSRYRNAISNLEGLSVGWSFGNRLAVCTSDNLQAAELLELE